MGKYCHKAKLLELFDNVFTGPLPPLALLRLLLRVRPLGLLYAGLPCDSMGFMSSSVHQRSALDPWGAPRVFVFLGNLLSCRLSILVLVGIARGVTWMLENPLRTAVDYLPPIQWLLQPHLRPLLAKWFLVFHWQPFTYFFKGCWFHTKGKWQKQTSPPPPGGGGSVFCVFFKTWWGMVNQSENYKGRSSTIMYRYLL